MSLNVIKSMLSTLIQYKNCDIIHTFSEQKVRLVEVRYLEEMEGFKLIDLLIQKEIICSTLEEASFFINQHIENYKKNIH